MFIDFMWKRIYSSVNSVVQCYYIVINSDYTTLCAGALIYYLYTNFQGTGVVVKSLRLCIYVFDSGFRMSGWDFTKIYIIIMIQTREQNLLYH